MRLGAFGLAGADASNQQGDSMKTVNFAVAMLAAVSMVVTPVAPSFAFDAPGGRAEQVAKLQAVTAKSTHQKIATHAERGEAAILSKAQVDRLATTNPKLHARLMAAYNSGTVPSLTAKEKKMLIATTQANLKQYKAGDPRIVGTAAVLSAGGWFVVGFLVVVALLMFLHIFAPSVFYRPRLS